MIKRRPLTQLLLMSVCAAMATASSAAASDARVAGVPRDAQPGDPVRGELVAKFRGGGPETVVEVPDGVRDREALQQLRRNPNVRHASRDYVVSVAARAGNDPGTAGIAGAWREDQWHLIDSAGGIDVGPAWNLLTKQERRFGRISAEKRGPVIAVVDTGVAYRDFKGRFKRSPDLARKLFVKGRDFVGDDPIPLDRFGHGTHIASTIGESIFNGKAVRGIAPGAQIMPIRVLDADGFGRTSDVAAGIRYAVRNGARLINTSIEYGGSVKSCHQIAGLCRAIRKAHRAGAIVIAAAGNSGRHDVPLPSKTLVVGAATVRGCLAAYSNRGPEVDILAPGGGRDAAGAGPGCQNQGSSPGVVQLTLDRAFAGKFESFGYPRTVGSSSAAAHATGVAALLIASRVIGRDPGAKKIYRRLHRTGREPAGLPANAGEPRLLDAARALGIGWEPPLPL